MQLALWYAALEGNPVREDRDNFFQRFVDGITLVVDTLFGTDLGGITDTDAIDLSNLIGEIIGGDIFGSGIVDASAAIILDTIGDVSVEAINTVSTVSSSVLGEIGRVGTLALNSVRGTSQGLLNRIDGFVRDNIGLIGRLFGTTNDSILDLLRNGTALFELLTGRAIDAVEKSVNESVDILANAQGRIADAIVPLIVEAARENLETNDLIQEQIRQQLEQSRENAESINENLAEAIRAITGESESALAVTREALIGSAAEQALATEAGAERVAGSIDENVGGIGTSIADFFAGFTKEETDTTRDAVREAVRSAIEFSNCPDDFRGVLDNFVFELLGKFSVMGGAAQLIMIPQLINTVISPVLLVLGNCIAQAAARLAPSTLPAEGDVRDQLRRDIIGLSEATESLLSQGYSFDRTANILAQRFEVPELGLVQTFWLRGLITTEQAIRGLSHLGYDNETIEHILQISFFIPPIQDLITMAVREVFTPEVAARFGQFQDFPDAFAQFAGQQGVSSEWAQRYWAAHWGLPSPAQGFEMFHRRKPGSDEKIIDLEELNILLRALDIMPFWRDKLIDIAFRPITRVDIRRFHKLGLMDTAEINKRYQDIGFSPPDATLMTAFTVEFNRPKDDEDVSALEGVTRSMVLRLFAQGTFNEVQAVTVLRELGVSDLAIPILIEFEKVKLEERERDASADLLVAQAKAGLITFLRAFDLLGGLGLEPTELARSQTKLERARASQTKLPSRTEGERMLTAGIITESQYIDLLERLGFSTVWSQRFLTLSGAV